MSRNTLLRAAQVWEVLLGMLSLEQTLEHKAELRIMVKAFFLNEDLKPLFLHSGGQSRNDSSTWKNEAGDSEGFNGEISSTDPQLQLA